MDLREQLEEVVRAIQVTWVASGGNEKAKDDNWAEDGDGVGKDYVSLLYSAKSREGVRDGQKL